jgi:S1-C subfamily serine protease
LAVGDTITSIGGRPVTSPQTLSTLIKSHRPGESASVSWKDPSGGGHTATVTFTTGPPD